MLAAPPHQSGRFLSSKLTRTLLIWTAAHSPLLSPLPLCVLRAISSYLFHYRFLALIYHSTICYFDTEDKEWKQLSSLRRSLAAHSQAYSMTFIQDYYVFVCGGMGSPPSATAHLVEFQTVTILRDMRVGRSGHSLAYVPQADAVFVFGGINSRLQPITGRLDVCEKFELATGRWGKMQRMTEPRANFNSVVHENVVYICGGSGKRTIETYDWTKDEFAVMAIRGVSGLGPTIATVHCGRLICVSRRGVWKWRIGTSEVETLKVRTERQLHSVAAGRVIAGVMYSVSDSQCIGIRLDTGEEVGCWKFLRFAVL